MKMGNKSEIQNRKQKKVKETNKASLNYIKTH